MDNRTICYSAFQGRRGIDVELTPLAIVKLAIAYAQMNDDPRTHPIDEAILNYLWIYMDTRNVRIVLNPDHEKDIDNGYSHDILIFEKVNNG
jgi:hypothetical protein